MFTRSIKIFGGCLATFLVLPEHGFAESKPLLIEAEDFEFPGDWIPAWGAGQNLLGVVSHESNHPQDALTVVDLPESGEYTIWTNSRDYAHDKPKSRRYQLRVNQIPMDRESGTHGGEGWAWERVGRLSLEQGENVLELHDTTNFYARCDAVLLTQDASYDPNDDPNVRRFRVSPKRVGSGTDGDAGEPGEVRVDQTWKVEATLEGPVGRLRFLSGVDAGGKPRVVRQIDLWEEEGFMAEPVNAAGETLTLIEADGDPEISFGRIIPYWSNNGSVLEVGGKTYQVVGGDDFRNPFRAGYATVLVARAVTDVTEEEVAVRYEGPGGEKIVGVWSLSDEPNVAKVRFSFSPEKAGFYSLALSAFSPSAREEVADVQLPPLYQFQRLPASPTLVPSTLTPVPAAIVEFEGGQPQTAFVSGDPAAFPLEWGTGMSSIYGFSLLNVRGEVQLGIFAPVLGTERSYFEEGEELSVDFIVGAAPSDWKAVFELITTDLYGFRDYREQYTGSLTDAVLNIIELLADDDASGWDPELKGYYDIEGDPHISPVVAQASPLAVLSAAVLTEDEDFYLKRALPGIEYTLSRLGFRYSGKPGSPHFNEKSDEQFVPFSPQFNTAYYQGLDALLGGKNPWIGEAVLMEGGRLRPTAGYAVPMPGWTQYLAAERLKPGEGYLDQAIRGADRYIAQKIDAPQKKPVGVRNFYNTNFYPYWWDLLDLYEMTGDEKYLEAAEDMAYQTMAGIRIFPSVEDGLMTIHPGGVFQGDSALLWKGQERFRLGFPTQPGDFPERLVSQAQVSPVGLGLEQPTTLFGAEKANRQIMMTSWSPSLLRLYEHTGNELLLPYARNGIIGRFSNYPGYYLGGFTDVAQQPDFPYVGPDISSIYFHHIPPHLAFALDFLVAEAVERSKGHVRFPWARQEGFVWFDNRVYGMGEGEIFGEKARLFLNSETVLLDNQQVNYLTAKSPGMLWIILMNEDAEAVNCGVSLLEGAQVDTAATGTVYEMDGTVREIAVEDSAVSLLVPAKGELVLALPSRIAVSQEGYDRIPPVRDGFLSVPLGEPWGTLYAFRIRSPFGVDSIYAYTSRYVGEGANVILRMLDPLELEERRSGFPYEFTVYPINPGVPVRFELELHRPGAEPEVVGPLGFPASGVMK
ncbi:hypothetical protein [Puniceicoccus vermicola]|uniref:Uncharacterized protein n=1 Tax=Puniceicoccus vermicola TaxID=388746 RepID=A0A7X1E444_9BACT|nr:hypothetical protein [Puniceicoccus vermicola]MBC2601746.1 hypothetical protein [Puniceicoccus vermicola]